MMRKWAMVAVATAVVFSLPWQMQIVGPQGARAGMQKSLSAEKARHGAIVERTTIGGRRSPRQPRNVIKLFVMKSGCFGLVDRTRVSPNRNIERRLAQRRVAAGLQHRPRPG